MGVEGQKRAGVEVVDLLRRELESVNVFVDKGLWEEITLDNFPNLGEREPDRLAYFRWRAVNNCFWDLNTARRNYPDRVGEVSRVMSDLRGEMAKCIDQITGIGNDAEEYVDLFLPNETEMKSMMWAVELGCPELLDVEQFPSFGAIPRREQLGLKLDAYNNAINLWRTREMGMKTMLGFGKEDKREELEVFQEIINEFVEGRDGIVEELAEMGGVV